MLAGTGRENRTGSPAHGGGYVTPADCSTGSGCHDASTTSFLLNFSLTDVSVTPNTLSLGTFIPGHKYLVKINGAYSSEPATPLPSFGFQCAVVGWLCDSDRFHGAPPAVRRGSPATYGYNPFTSNIPAGVDTFLANGAYLIENTSTLTNHGASSILSSWEATFYWQAPADSVLDSVGFWYVLCAVDGDSTSAHDVTFIGPPDGTIYADEFGCGAAVNNVFKNTHFSCYPNPVKDQLHIHMSDLQTGAYAVNVFDISGRKVFVQNLNIKRSAYNVQINTTAWPDGIYQVQFTKDGAQHTISIVKQ